MIAESTLTEVIETDKTLTTDEQGTGTEQSSAAGATETQTRQLDNLMRRALARRQTVRQAQEKLRDIELELRTAKADKRSRFERMREAALDEYKRARTEASRARHQLIGSLRMMPSRT